MSINWFSFDFFLLATTWSINRRLCYRWDDPFSSISTVNRRPCWCTRSRSRPCRYIPVPYLHALRVLLNRVFQYAYTTTPISSRFDLHFPGKRPQCLHPSYSSTFLWKKMQVLSGKIKLIVNDCYTDSAKMVDGEGVLIFLQKIWP